MEFLVVNGSPKNEVSVTQQYVRWLEQRFGQHDFPRLHVARELRQLERDPAAVEEVVGRMRSADAVLWAFPVYYFLVPSQMKRFVELLFEAGAGGQLKDCYATSLSTSIHFFDHTAHEYVQAVSEDLGMRYVEGLSAGMESLLGEEFRDSLAEFWEGFADMVERGAPVGRRFAPLVPASFTYRPGRVEPVGEKTGRRIVILSDAGKQDVNLRRMERVLTGCLADDVERIEIGKLGLKGGCLGCIRCGWDGKCVYRDGFDRVYREKILSADALILSGGVRDRYLSARWKRFFDRSFFLGHRPVWKGKQLLWLVSGPLRQLTTLRHVLESHAQIGKSNLVDVITDEVESTAELTARLREGAARFERALIRGLRKPRTFPAVAGTKLFRDFVFLATSIFKEDDRYYSEQGIYDFPHKKLRRILFDRSLGLAMLWPPFRKRVQRDMRKLMLKPLERVVGPVEQAGSPSA